MDITTSEKPTEVDLSAIYLQLKENNRNVFMYQFGQQIFFYRSIGRKEYRIIQDDQDLNELQKENVICDVCTLWPQNINWNEVDAGIPEKLTEMIIKNSFLDSMESRQKLLAYYRSEMYDLDNQISCMIHEAFPQFDLEDIEEWGVEKTTKYLSRAEWKLHNLRGINFVEPEGEFRDAPQQQQVRTQQVRQRETPQKHQDDRRSDDQISIRGQDKRASKLTPETIEQREERLRNQHKGPDISPEKAKAMEEFARKFPQFDVFNDDIMKHGIEGMQGNSGVSGPLKTPDMM